MRIEQILIHFPFGSFQSSQPGKCEPLAIFDFEAIAHDMSGRDRT